MSAALARCRQRVKGGEVARGPEAAYRAYWA